GIVHAGRRLAPDAATSQGVSASVGGSVSRAGGGATADRGGDQQPGERPHARRTASQAPRGAAEPAGELDLGHREGAAAGSGGGGRIGVAGARDAHETAPLRAEIGAVVVVVDSVAVVVDPVADLDGAGADVGV